MERSIPNKLRPSPWPPSPDSAAMPPSPWAKRTGFRPKFSGETNDSGQITALPPPLPPVQAPARPELPDSSRDLEDGSPSPGPATSGDAKEKEDPVRKRRDSDGGRNVAAGEGSRDEAVVTVDVLPPSVLDDDGFVARHSHMKYELRHTPGLASSEVKEGRSMMQNNVGFYFAEGVHCSLLLRSCHILAKKGVSANSKKRIHVGDIEPVGRKWFLEILETETFLES